jgi:hypothetical protein
MKGSTPGYGGNLLVCNEMRRKEGTWFVFNTLQGFPDRRR